MRLAVVAASDPLNIRTWSGTPYFMTRTLQDAFTDLVPVRHARPLWLHHLRRATKRATGGRIDLYWNHSLAASNAKRLARRLKADGTDVAFCIGNAPISAFLADELPTIHVSDATVPLMREYYQEFSRLPEMLARSASRLDRMSVLRSRACLFATDWAARSAIRDYGADPARVHAIPWGANIEPGAVPPDADAVPAEVCHLVFIGVDWARKGGAIAVAAAARLAASGHAVKLHIIGATPDLGQTGEVCVVHGFINKGTDEGRRAFDRIMAQAAFLFVPTRQDCYGMVFPEANAYGVPVITTRTGGVPGAVREGVNGHLLDIAAGADAYADLIWKVWSDRAGYAALRTSSRAQFNRSLNWNSWLSAAAPIIEDVASGSARQQRAGNGKVRKGEGALSA